MPRDWRRYVLRVLGPTRLPRGCVPCLAFANICHINIEEQLNLVCSASPQARVSCTLHSVPFSANVLCCVGVETGRPAVHLPAVTLEMSQVRYSHRSPPGLLPSSRALRPQLLLAEGRQTGSRNRARGVARRPQSVPHGDPSCR